MSSLKSVFVQPRATVDFVITGFVVAVKVMTFKALHGDHLHWPSPIVAVLVTRFQGHSNARKVKLKACLLVEFQSDRVKYLCACWRVNSLFVWLLHAWVSSVLELRYVLRAERAFLLCSWPGKDFIFLFNSSLTAIHKTLKINISTYIELYISYPFWWPWPTFKGKLVLKGQPESYIIFLKIWLWLNSNLE